MKSLEELKKIREQVRKDLELRSGEHRGKVVICMGTCGIAAGARETMSAIMEALDAAKVTDIAVTAAGCAGFCEKEPLIEVQIQDQKPVRYGNVDAAAAKRIVSEHIVGGKPVAELIFA
jgi:NADP-reducing hydrogenase subunit HndB